MGIGEKVHDARGAERERTPRSAHQLTAGLKVTAPAGWGVQMSAPSDCRGKVNEPTDAGDRRTG